MLPYETNNQIIYNNVVEERSITQNNQKYNLAFSKSGFLAGIIKIPPKGGEKILSYQELPRTKEDEKKIEDLITTMSIHGKLTLLFEHEKRLRKEGDELRYLHPFKFIGYIFSRSDLKKHMKVIFEDYFKRTNFIDDFAKTMDYYDFKNKLNIYLEDFAKEVNVPSNNLSPFMQNKDWEGLVRFLITN